MICYDSIWLEGIREGITALINKKVLCIEKLIKLLISYNTKKYILAHGCGGVGGIGLVLCTTGNQPVTNGVYHENLYSYNNLLFNRPNWV